MHQLIESHRNKMTLFCDIDGTIIEHEAQPSYNNREKLLEGVKETLEQFKNEGHQIIFTTTRSEHQKVANMLHHLQISYDRLITGIASGPRIIIND